jgi:endonuclease/exonuclease/phosphatase family metal-dependent hydrolase
MRIVTYNIRHGRGVDQLVSTRRIAAVLAALEPDVVCLNEVRSVPALSDQPRVLARLLGLRGLFQHNHGAFFMRSGNLLLARGPVSLAADLLLPGGLEQRGCLVARVETGGLRFLVATTHLSLGRSARAVQLADLAARLPRDLPLVVAGDLNCALTEATALRAALAFADPAPATFPSRRPRRALDHVGWSRHWRPTTLRTVPSLASDHLPLVADLELV